MSHSSPTHIAYPTQIQGLRCALGVAALLLCASACGGGDDSNAGVRASGNGGTGKQIGGAGTKGTAGNDFGNVPKAPAGSGGALGGMSTGTAGTSDGSCAQGMATATPVTPTIWLVVDGSSSMEMEFSNGMSRWVILRSTLMGPGGVVETLEKSARIGIVIYSGPTDLLGTGACPSLITVQPALNNFAAIDAAYPAKSIAMHTPTAEAMEYVVSTLPVVNMDTLDMQAEPIYVVLATDGQPNGCGGGGGGGNAEQGVIAAVTKGTQAGMNMFVVSLAGGDGQLQSHLEQVAQATQTKTPPFVPSTQADLVSTFQTIIGGATCQVGLSGTVADGKACQGEVKLNGNQIECESDNGWRLSDPRTVQLTGSVCDTFRMSQSLVVADFPCDAFSPD